MSMLLTTAIALHDHIIEPRSNVLLIFQPAEEGPGGAQRMVQEGILSRFNVSAIYGYHLHPEYPFGSIASRAGAFFANCVEIYFNVKGKSSHGAQPQNGRDALLAVANLVTQISALSAKTNSPFEDSVIMLGRLSAGDRLNIVAEHAILEGSIRTYSIEARDKLIKRLFDISEGISKSFEVDVTFKPVYFYPALFNSEALYNDAKEKLTDLIHAEKVMLSEDFSYYADEIPALFMLLGIDDANPAHQNSLHSSSFDFDEEVLLYGVDGYLKLLV
jgi:amidohydrolase